MSEMTHRSALSPRCKQIAFPLGSPKIFEILHFFPFLHMILIKKDDLRYFEHTDFIFKETGMLETYIHLDI